MKKIGLVFLGVLLLAASCQQQSSGQNSSLPSGNLIDSILIEPSYKDGDYTMYSDGAAVKVTAKTAAGVEIKYTPEGAGQEEKSLGQATSLSSQQYAWALPLPKDLKAASFWAEAKDGSGNVVKSQSLGGVRYETLNSYKSPAKTGFSISYLGDFGFSTDYGQVKTLSYIPSCEPDMAACAFLRKETYSGTNFDGGGVSIVLRNDLSTETKCYDFSAPTNEARQAAGEVNINGVTFKSATGGSGAAGHSARVQAYRNFHNKTCYEIVQRVASANIGNYPEGAVTQFDESRVWQKLQLVVNSFKFTGSASGNQPEFRQVAVTGTAVCLPHKNVQPGQPQTLECAIGLKEDSTGKYYGLKNIQPPFYGTNVKIKAAGTLVDDSASNYDTVGAIDNAKIEVLSK